MSSSPYTPSTIKKYMQHHKIQQLINSTVNKMLKQQPDDPYGFMIGLLKNKASSDIRILQIKVFQTMPVSEGQSVVKITASISYLNQQRVIVIKEPFGVINQESGIINDNGGQQDKGKRGLSYFNQVLAQKVKGFKCTEQSDIDKQIQTAFKDNKYEGLYLVNTLSFVISKIQAQVLSQQLYSIVRSVADTPQPASLPQISYMINCLHGGKVIGSKCKITKFMIFNNSANKNTDPLLASTILHAIRKSIVSGKAGQAGLKISPDGTFVCPLDTINDNLKIVQDAVNNTPNAKQSFFIGLSWAADTLYSVDTKKYELQNPKTPFDNDQMIDYLVKICVDKPLIKYLQDPLASSEKQSWKKLKSKLSENQVTKNVRLGSRVGSMFKFAQDNITQELKSQVQQLSQPITADSAPELSAEQIEAKNKNKFSLDYFQCRLFELRTLTEAVNLSSLFAKYKTKLILQDNLFETADTSIIDYSFGLNGMACIGSINGSKTQRLSKLYRVKQIKQLWNLWNKQSQANNSKG